MKPGGSRTPYPQLESYVWLDTYQFLGHKGIAKLLGCAPKVAKKRLTDMGLWRNERRYWTNLETELFLKFFPRYESKLLATALRRSIGSIHRKARGIPLKKVPLEERGTDAEFWTEWQEHIMSLEFREQIDRDNWVWYMELSHSGAQQEKYVQCGKCEYRPMCDGAAKEPLPCMTTLVGDVLR